MFSIIFLGKKLSFKENYFFGTLNCLLAHCLLDVLTFDTLPFGKIDFWDIDFLVYNDFLHTDFEYIDKIYTWLFVKTIGNNKWKY